MDDINYDNVKWIKPFQEDYKPPREPIVDREISRIVGKTILTDNPKVIELVKKWKLERLNKNIPSDVPDNFLHDPNKIKELKQAFK